MDFKILGDGEDEIIDIGATEFHQPKNDVPNIPDSAKSLGGRSDNTVFGQYIQSAPMLFTRDGHNMWFGDMYRGKSAMLLLSGPSFHEVLNGYSDHYKKPYPLLFNHPGLVTMAVNNSISNFRTNMWVSNDKPSQFVRSVWMDPRVMKFCPYDNVDKPIFNSDTWEFTDTTPGDSPNTWFFKRNDRFNADTFMYEDTFNWGSHKDYGGKRSVMLIALRLLHYLGIRKIFLFGCDFKMSKDYTYHFKQERHESSIRSNNSTYDALKERFEQLKPHFEKLGLEIYNCNPDSTLKAFPFLTPDEAFQMALDGFPDVDNERTDGLYDREYKIRQAEKQAAKEAKKK